MLTVRQPGFQAMDTTASYLYTFRSVSDVNGLIAFPNPEFCMYTMGYFLVAKW